MDKIILKVLACPLCKGKLHYDETMQELVCRFDKLAYPIKNETPIMLVEQTRNLKDTKDTAILEQKPLELTAEAKSNA